MEAGATPMDDEANVTTEEDVEMGESTSDVVKEEEQRQLPKQPTPEKSAPEDKAPQSHDVDGQGTKRKSLASRDPCGTPKQFKVLFEKKVAELDTGGTRIVPSTWQATDDGDDEDEQLIPQERAPEVEKPPIVERRFEEEIKHLLKCIETKFPTRNNKKEADEINIMDRSSKLFEVADTSVPYDPDVLFQFDTPKSGILVDDYLTDFDKVLERLKEPNLRRADNIDERMMDFSDLFERKDRPTTLNLTPRDQAGPSTRPDNIVQSARTIDKMEVSEMPDDDKQESIPHVPTDLDDKESVPRVPTDMDDKQESVPYVATDLDDKQESVPHVPTDLDEMLILPSLDSEDDRILVDIDNEIKALPLSQPSQDETEFAVPSTVSEDGVVLPVVPTLFDDDTSAVPGTLGDETTLSGTFYEEAFLPEVSEENNQPGSLSDIGIVSSDLNREDESIEPRTFEKSATQREDILGGNQTVSSLGHVESNTSYIFRGRSESALSPVSLIDEALPVADDLLSPVDGAFAEDGEEGGSVVPSSVQLPNRIPSSSPLMNGSTSQEGEVDLRSELRLPVVPDEDTEELLRNLGALPKAGTVSLPGQRRYDSESLVKWEEDQLREFKGHRNVSAEEVPPWCLVEPRTRSPISRNICGFLNTGMGGTVYVGILNNGTVRGEPMTLYQQDHLLLSLKDTLLRFRPPVPLHLVKATFVPVLEPWDRCPAEDSPSCLQYDEEARRRPHRLRTYVSCWCDWEATARLKQGIQSRRYVIEITVLPVDPDDPLLSHMKPNSLIRTRPTFQADDAQIYFRKHASTIKCSMRDIEERAKDEVLLYKMPQLMSAWREYLTHKKLTEVVEEALVQHGDDELVEMIRQLEKKADNCTYRLVQERHPLYRY
ncbi:uncharacterized protein [Anabrus simplex]|uniref:uncharacterized protein n=1 Tax=Anabrus simplex TaxID=316456 RepID=UPI0035A2D259